MVNIFSAAFISYVFFLVWNIDWISLKGPVGVVFFVVVVFVVAFVVNDPPASGHLPCSAMPSSGICMFFKLSSVTIQHLFKFAGWMGAVILN